MENKEKNIWGSIFSKIFLALFFTFLALHIAGLSGYYEYELQKKVILTEGKIAKFEQDVTSGNMVDLKDYLKEEEINYSTNLSKAGLYLSDNFSQILKNTVETTFSFINRLVEG